MIEVDIQDAELLRVLRRVISSVERPRPLMVAFGELGVDSTKQRFQTSTDPDGQRWIENSDVTLLNYLRRYSRTFGKRGGLTKKGITRLANKKPLIGETKALSTRINYQATNDSVAVGSPEVQAAMLHFGGKKSQFKNLWGDIPARPFLGISDSDAGSILDTVADFLSP
jgi:phage gpG-like protein